MNKEELLNEVSNKISTGEISREEIMVRFGLASVADSQINNKVEKSSSSFPVTKLLYVLGASIVTIGIVIFVHQIWDDIGSFGRILITLGLGFLLAAIGSMLLKQKPNDSIGSVFHFIGGLLIPGGAVVTLSEINPNFGNSVVAITFIAISVFYILLSYIHKKAVLTFFAIANGTATVYLILNVIVGSVFDGALGIENIYQYATMLLGLSYLLFAHSFRDGYNSPLIGLLHFFGITGFLGASFSQVFDSGPWQLLYFLFILGGIALSVYVRSRSILVMSTLFLVAHVSYITGEYFADSLGWPISLVMLGLIFIGLGYATVNINRKYISNHA